MAAESNESASWTELFGFALERLSDVPNRAIALLHDLMDAGRGIVGCAESAVLVPSDQPNTLKFLVSANTKPETATIVKGLTVPTDKSLVGCVFNTGQLIAVANPESFYDQVDQQTGLETSVYMAIPIVDANGDVLGVATFLNRPSGEEQAPFGPEEIEAASRLTDLVASGLRFAQRVGWQSMMFQQELNTAAQAIAGRPTKLEAPHLDIVQWEDGELKAIALSYLEQLPATDLGLANELLGVLAARSLGNAGRDT